MLSKRSSNPPWPGIDAPISLIPMSRLIDETIRSPNCPATLTIKPSPINFTGVSTPEQEKTNDPNSNSLGITTRFIAQNRDHRQQDHGEWWNRDKESVPMIRDCESGRDDAKHHHDAEGAVTKKSSGTRELAITKDAQNRDCQNRPCRPQ